jgi:hypothetical protein
MPGAVPYYVSGPQAPRTEPMAIWSFVLSIVGALLACCWIGLASTITAIPLGISARKRIRESGGTLTGDGLALAGIIIGSIATGLAAILFVLNVFFSVASFIGTSN